MSVGTGMIWGAWNWLQRLAGARPPSRGFDGEELKVRTRAELLALAKEAGIRGRHRMSRHELVNSLLSAEPDAALAKKRAADSMEEPVGLRAPEPAPSIARPPGRRSPGARGTRKVGPLAKARTRTVVEPRVVEPETASAELTDLPASYRVLQLTLLEVEPCRVYAYWEVTAEECDKAVERLVSRDDSAVWVLRLYDVTCINFDGNNAHSYFDVPIETTASGWYVDLWSGDKSYCAEIGLRSADGRFAPMCRSNFIDLPRSEPAAQYQPEWLNVEGLFDRVEFVPEPAPEDGRAEPLATVVREAEDSSAEKSHVAPVDTLSGEAPIELTGGEAGRVSAGSRNVKSSLVAVGVAQEESWRRVPPAMPAGESLSPPVEQARQVEGGGWEGSAVSRGAAPVSEGAPEPRGNDGLVSEGQVFAASPVTPQLAVQGKVDRSTPSAAPGGVISLGQPTPEQNPRPPWQVSQTEMSRRYEPLLVGAPGTSRGPEMLARENPGSDLGVPPLQIRVERRRQISPSSHGVSSFGSGGSWDVSRSRTDAEIDLKLNAEVVIYGRAQPGQTVQVNGRWVEVRPDGTFSLRLALPVVKE